VAAENTHAYYLRDLGCLLREEAEDALRQAREARAGQRDFAEGMLHAYMRILSLMQQQADAFELPYGDLMLEGLDPERDLIVTSDMPTPPKRSRWPKTVRIGPFHLILFVLRESRRERNERP
jgi:hypothetical protein